MLNEHRRGGATMRGIFIALALAALIPFVLLIILLPMFREMKVSKGVTNQDVFAQNYLFKVNCARDDFLKTMNMTNIHDILEYSFETKAMTITFSKYGANIPYTVFIKEFDGGCYIKLSKNVLIQDRSNIPYQINEFMIKKFNAELLPYDEYKDIVT